MLDIGMTELLLIGIVALIVVGPKDLPGMFRTLGKFTARIRGMARDFQRSMEEAADESGVGSISKDLKNIASARNLGLNTVKDAASSLIKDDPAETNTKAKSTTAKKPSSTKKAAPKAKKPAKPKVAKPKSSKPKTPAAKTKSAAKTAAPSKSAKATPAAKKSPAKAKTSAAKTPQAKATAKAKKPKSGTAKS